MAICEGTFQGRLVGTVVMIMGIGLLGAITALIASNFNQTNSGDSVTDATSTSNSKSLNKVEADLDALKKRIMEIENKLEN